MLLQKSMLFCSVLSFVAIGLTMNYQFSSILCKEAPKFEACIITYF